MKYYLLDLLFEEKRYHTRVDISHRKPMKYWTPKNWNYYIQPVLDSLYPGCKCQRIISPEVILDPKENIIIHINIKILRGKTVVQSHESRVENYAVPVISQDGEVSEIVSKMKLVKM